MVTKIGIFSSTTGRVGFLPWRIEDSRVMAFLDEKAFSLIIVKIIDDLHEWVMDTLDGIDSELLKLFLIDFVQQVINNTFTVSPSDPPFDPMYG